jgi:hypothetical protein
LEPRTSLCDDDSLLELAAWLLALDDSLLELEESSLELDDSSLELEDEQLGLFPLLLSQPLSPWLLALEDSSLELDDSSLELEDSSLELDDSSLELEEEQFGLLPLLFSQPSPALPDRSGAGPQAASNNVEMTMRAIRTKTLRPRLDRDVFMILLF